MKSKRSIYSLDYGDSFWYIGEVSRVYCYYLGNSLNFYKYSLETGNIFLTKEEAKIELKKRQIIAKIKKYCWENNIDLADNEYIKNTKNLKWFIKYILERKIFEKESERWVYCNYIFCFKNEADIEKVIRNCENDLKIIFDV